MAPKPSILERYTILMGGEHNLPKQNIPAQPKEDVGLADAADAPDQFVEALTSSMANNTIAIETAQASRLPPETSHSDHQASSSQPRGGEKDCQNSPPPSSAIERDHFEPHVAPSRGPASIATHPMKYAAPGFSNHQVDGKIGEAAPLGTNFCPILAIAKFPYKYMDKGHSETVADRFFNAGQFWERNWNLYYVWTQNANPGKPLIFITETQFRSLIAEINHAFPSFQVRVPSYALEDGLITEFDDNSNLRPHWLGTSSSRAQYDLLESKAPLFTMVGHPRLSKDSLRAFKEKIDNAALAAKSKKNANKAKKAEVRVAKQQDMTRQLFRAQRYLGLRPMQTESNTSAQGHPSQEAAATTSLMNQPICSDIVCPYAFDSDTIFISVDIESWERSHNTITEIGVAILDTRDIKHVAPGHRGNKWFEHIRAKHFRIKEHANYVNTDFVHGCPDKFEFGTSDFVKLSHAPKAIEALFNHPYGREASMYEDNGTPEKRNIVFVGHDATNDTSYLRQLGYDPIELPNLIEVMDTALMHRALVRGPNNRSLGQVLYELEISGWNLHNAGNDAVYTMQAMLAMSVDAAERDEESLAEQRKVELEARIAAAKQLAEQRAREEAEGWSADEDNAVQGARTNSTDREDDAGGVKLPQQSDEIPIEGVLLTAGGGILDI